MKKLVGIIDSITRNAAVPATWLCYVLILIVVFEVIMRYVFNAPTRWGYETAIMTGGTMYALGWAYTHLNHGHVRVDVIYSHLSLRTRAIIDVFGTLVFLLPLLIILVSASGKWALRSWLTNEKLTQTYWYPPFAPFRTIVLIGFCLFTFQAIAQFIRDLYISIKDKQL